VTFIQDMPKIPQHSEGIVKSAVHSELESQELFAENEGSTCNLSDSQWDLREAWNKVMLSGTLDELSPDGDKSENDNLDLNNKIIELDKRLDRVEKIMHIGNIERIMTPSVKRHGADVAIGTMSRDLITSIPRNEGITSKIHICWRVLSQHHFAVFQCLLMAVALMSMFLFGWRQFLNVDEEMSKEYKPFKARGRDEYYLNKDLRYNLPHHYFWFEISVSTNNFSDTYNRTFDRSCESSIDDCLFEYLYDFLNPKLVIDPTNVPTSSPTTLPPTFSPTPYPTDKKGGKWTSTGVGKPSVTDIASGFSPPSYVAPLSAICLMTTSDAVEDTLTTNVTGLRNLTMYINGVGVEPRDTENGFDTIETFGVLLKLDFDDFDRWMSGKLKCFLNLKAKELDIALSSFANYDIHFLVSRVEYSSGSVGVSEWIRSMKKIRGWDDDVREKSISYIYEESTFDGVADFEAEVSVETGYSWGTPILNIEASPNPTVVHYKSFDNYSYMDWIADVGGFFTLAVSIFLFMSTRIMKFAGRDRLFLNAHGILPMFSLPHRNAEELAGLRSIVLAALGVTEEEYFGNLFKTKLNFLSFE